MPSKPVQEVLGLHQTVVSAKAARDLWLRAESTAPTILLADVTKARLAMESALADLQGLWTRWQETLEDGE